MKKFKFNLETLLKVREQQENVAKQALGEAQAALQALYQQIDDLNAEGQKTELAVEQQKSRGFSAPELAASLQYLDSLRGRVALLEDDVMRANNVVQQRRQEVAKAMQERKAIENLKEKRHEEWRKEMARAEKNFLDEQATMRFVHGKDDR